MAPPSDTQYPGYTYYLGCHVATQAEAEQYCHDKGGYLAIFQVCPILHYLLCYLYITQVARNNKNLIVYRIKVFVFDISIHFCEAENDMNHTVK